ncbi:MAG: oligosaccharide flippase family protein, partial [Bacteroidales bacterium]|nr:oligosaccharide flippase family protein [Bacteroidales bacterium]
IVSIWTLFKLPMIYAVIAFPVTDMLMSVVLHILNSKAFSTDEVKKSWVEKHLRFGFKSILTEVFSSIHARIPVLIIGYFLNDNEAGMYSIAATMASGIMIIASIMQDNFNPVVANLHSSGDTEKLGSYVRKLKKFSLFSLLPLIVASVVLYKVYILLLGSQYKETSAIFYYLIAGVGLTYLVSWAGGVLTMTGNQMLNLVRILITLAITVAGCIVMIPLMGVKGAAIAFIFSSLVNVVVLYFFILHRTRIKIL